MLLGNRLMTLSALSVTAIRESLFVSGLIQILMLSVLLEEPLSSTGQGPNKLFKSPREIKERQRTQSHEYYTYAYGRSRSRDRKTSQRIGH